MHSTVSRLVTNKGTLLVYCEARAELSDWAMMDVLLQRSVDGGISFSEKVKIASGTQEHPTVNNPVMVQDLNGRIHFLYCEDYAVGEGRLLRRFSDDDGLTWSEPIDITRFTMPEYRNALALGPGHGVSMKDGTLVFPLWMVPKRFQEPLHFHKPSEVSTIYSKDFGETWAVGELLPNTAEVVNPNETSLALTSDGRVYLNIRQLGTHRVKAYSATGYSGWTEYAPDYSLPDPRCFGSVSSYDDGEGPYALIFANCACQTERKNVVVRMSEDDGKTFPVSRVIDAERGGYVETAVDSVRDRIYVLYENNKGETCHFVAFNRAWLAQEEFVAQK